MANESNIPKEIQDGVREVLGRKVKLAIKRMVRMEIKLDKYENKVLALSACRLFVLSAKVPTKVDHTFHYLDIQAIVSKKPNQLTLTVAGKNYSFCSLEAETEEINHIIIHIGVSLKHIFPAVQLERIIMSIDVIPPDRIKSMYNMMKDLECKDPGPCGGFSHMYACMCDYHSLPYREEVAWDVDTIYLSHASKELNLTDFDHLDTRDLIPIIAALEHNPWFSKLFASNTKLNAEALGEILKVMKKNTAIEELYLSSIAARWEFAEKLAVALLSNTSSPLTTIDLSHNCIEDRGMNHLSGPVSKLSRGLVCLNLASTGMTAKGVNKLAEALCSNRFIPTSLHILNLSGNMLKGEEITNLYNFLAQPNTITNLDLSGTECALDMVCGALLRGCCQNMTHLNLARNVFSSKRGKEVQVPLSWKQFFATTMALSYLNLSENRLPSEAVKNLLLGIASNHNLTELELDLSGNELRTAGAYVLQSCISEITSISSLDISDNGFDHDLAGLANWISQNKSIKKLSIGRNFNNIRPKHLPQVLDAIVEMIQQEGSAIESLSLADSKLKLETPVVINALGSNTSLTQIDISGNMMGDLGARMLSKALLINTKLHTVIWDKNNTTVLGFEDVASALTKNYTVRKMPTPITDASVALRAQPERTQAALQKIEVLLQRNHSPRKFASDQAYRLQQGFLISSTQQMVDRLVVSLQDTINALNRNPSESSKQDIEKAVKCIKDADNSKQLLPKLQEVSMSSEDDGSLIDRRLKTICQDLNQVIEQQLQKNVNEMLKCAKDTCPTVLEEESVRNDIQTACSEKSVLPRDFTKTLVLDQVGTDINNKVSALNLSVAAHMSDKIIDGVLETLSSSHKSLTNHLNAQLSAPVAQQQENKEKEEEKKKEDDKEEEEESEKDVTAGSKEDSNKEKLTLHIPFHGSPKLSSKKRSIYGRKLRPQSVILEDLDIVEDKDAGKEKPTTPLSPVPGTPSIITTPTTPPALNTPTTPTTPGTPKTPGTPTTPATPTSPTTPSSSSSSNPLALPVDSGHQRLQHLGKLRPKRNRTYAPKKASALVVSSPDDQMAEVNEGMESFFASKPVSTEYKPQEAVVNGQGNGSAEEKEENGFVPVKPETKKKSVKSPFGAAKEKSSMLAHGISSFFSRKGAKSPEPPKKKEEEKEASPLQTENMARKKSLENVTDDKPPPVPSSEPPSDETEEVVAEVQPPRRPAGLPKFGLPGMAGGGMAGGPNLLAEMKAKRANMRSTPSPVGTKEKDDKENKESPSSGLGLPGQSMLRPVSDSSPSETPARPRSILQPTASALKTTTTTAATTPVSPDKTEKEADRPAAKPRPPAPATKPKPPPVKPKPTTKPKPMPRRAKTAEKEITIIPKEEKKEDKAEEKDDTKKEEEEKKKKEEEKEKDSEVTSTGPSVKQRLSLLLAEGDTEQSELATAQRKARSLPRPTSMSTSPSSEGGSSNIVPRSRSMYMHSSPPDEKKQRQAFSLFGAISKEIKDSKNSGKDTDESEDPLSEGTDSKESSPENKRFSVEEKRLSGGDAKAKAEKFVFNDLTSEDSGKDSGDDDAVYV